MEVQAEAGSLENSLIWTPDIELYNHESAIWGHGAFGARLATVYSCWDGAPTRGGCGYVFWSRPGVVTALCKYSGLIKFPERRPLVRPRVRRLVPRWPVIRPGSSFPTPRWKSLQEPLNLEISLPS
jgi:hypothetical protein